MNTRKKSHQLILELISAVDEYEYGRKESDLTLEGFSIWLAKKELTTENKKLQEPSSIEEKLLKRVDSQGFTTDAVNVQITLLLTQLSRHFKLYSKKVLFDSDLVSMDGHIFLASLYAVESLKKNELIKSHFMEMPSGIEVIKRLLRKGFIEEFDDETDRRAKRVKITPKGKKEFEATLPDMRKVIHLMASNMESTEKIQLVGLLDQLNRYHNERHEEVKKSSLDQLLSKLNK